jgi:hypothetical protein
MLVSLRVLFYPRCSRAVLPQGAGRLTPALLYRLQSNTCFCKVLVSSRVLFCTECSRAVFFVYCWSAHVCFSVPNAVELIFSHVAGLPTRALLYRAQSSCFLCWGYSRVHFCTDCSWALVSARCLFDSPRVFFCAECSQAVFSACFWSAHACWDEESVAVTSRDDDTPGAAFCSVFSVDHFPAVQSSASGLLFHDHSFTDVGCVYFAKIVNHRRVDSDGMLVVQRISYISMLFLS